MFDGIGASHRAACCAAGLIWLSDVTNPCRGKFRRRRSLLVLSKLRVASRLFMVCGIAAALLWQPNVVRLTSAFPLSNGNSSPHRRLLLQSSWGTLRSTAHERIRRLALANNPLVSTFPTANNFVDAKHASASAPDAVLDTSINEEADDSFADFEAVAASPPLSAVSGGVVAGSGKSTTSTTSSASSLSGLSKFHLSILSRTTDRQRFVTGQYPVTVSVKENPTRKWLNLGRSSGALLAETEILVNGTTPSRSLASLDRFLWLEDDAERTWQQEHYHMVSLELLAEIHLDRPGYLQILDSTGAGALAAAAETFHEHQARNGNSNGWTLQAMKMLKRLESKSRAGSTGSSDSNSDPNQNGAMPFRDDIDMSSRDRLWVTGFSLVGRQGLITAVDCEHHYIKPVSQRSRNAMLWPNEVQQVPFDIVPSSLPTASSNDAEMAETPSTQQRYQDMLLVCDGFLVPTKDRGGLYIVKNPGHETEWTVCLTNQSDRWFYHRAVWIDLTGDGRRSILTARCKVSTVLDSKNTEGLITSGITKSGQLVWLECPKPAAHDPTTGTALESDGTIFDPFSARHLPWKTRVLATGPDVMFCVADLDTDDDSIEVISSDFFKQQVSLHSIRRSAKPKVCFSRTIDDSCGQAFGCILANLDPQSSDRATNRCVVDAGSTVGCLDQGDSFSHVLVTSHECRYISENGGHDDGSFHDVASESSMNGRPVEGNILSTPEGGSLFAYQVPTGKDAWKTEPWKRSTVASGFTVNGKLNNMVNPGAPGFVYTFYANRADAQKRTRRPLIAVAGDCAESAFIFRPETSGDDDTTEVATIDDTSCTNYKLMAEIECQATVGSIGIGYDDFGTEEQESGYAKLYVPCFEKDKILVFGLGSGADDTSGW